MLYLFLMFILVLVAVGLVITRYIPVAYSLIGGVALGLFLTAANSFLIVPSGNAALATFAGVVKDGRVYTEGVYVVNPTLSFPKYNVRRIAQDFRGEDRLVQLTADDVPLQLDLTVAWRLQPGYLDRFHRVVGVTYIDRLMMTQIRRSTRDAVIEMRWSGDAVEQREALAQRITQYLRRSLVNDLMSSGFTEEEAGSIFEIYDVQLRQVMPPERILAAVSEKMAAEQDLERQQTLTAIAEEEANRRQQEGMGITKLFAELPEGFTPADIRMILDAVSTKTRADAMQSAVSNGQVSTLIMFGDGGGGNNSAAVSVPHR
jgi:regulator of protease activity HflC (stomatin/prohibitin superfamily)